MSCHATPVAEHAWLRRFVGEWTIESECDMGPGQPAMKSSGRQTIRALGDCWTIGDLSLGEGENAMRSVITLGFDTRTSTFVGTFVADVMTHMWVYSGRLDEAQRVLTLCAQGPAFDGAGLRNFRDIIEVVSPDHYVLRSETEQPDGTWTHFMTMHHRRVS